MPAEHGRRYIIRGKISSVHAGTGANLVAELKCPAEGGDFLWTSFASRCIATGTHIRSDKHSPTILMEIEGHLISEYISLLP